MATFVLVHSPAVGPATWQPVADRLRLTGHEVVVPSLLAIANGEPPYWPGVAATVVAALAGADERGPLVLVAHSNAGAFLPVIAASVMQPVECCIFADALLPAAAGSTPLAGEQFLPFLGRPGRARRAAPPLDRLVGRRRSRPAVPGRGDQAGHHG